MPVWQAVLLGVVQGVTEFLPISSTAHLILAQRWLGRSQDEVETDPFTVVVQLGTLVAVVAYFRRDIVRIVKAFADDALAGRFVGSGTADGRLAKLIILGTVPAAVAGVTLKRWLKETFYNAPSIAVVSIAFALLLWLAEYAAARRKRAGRGDDEVTVFDAVLVGVFQALALMPGGSRSGTTLTAGLFAGLSRPAAAKFSFLLSLPIMAAAGAKDLYDWLKTVKADPALRARADEQATAMLVGTAVAAVVGYAAIAWLLAYLRKYPTTAFVVYRLLLGGLILALWFGGWLG